MLDRSLHVVAMPGHPAGSLLSLPNLISILRVLSVPLIYWSFKRSFDSLALILLGIAVLTDAMDGYLARRFRWQSHWGLVLDPLADKILIGSLAVFLVMFRNFPAWVAGLIIMRDILIVGVGIYLYVKPYRIIAPANRLGKLTTAVTSASLLLYTVNWQPYGAWCLDAALACILASGLYYMIGFIRLMREKTSLQPVAASSPPASTDPASVDAYRSSGA